MLHIEFSKDGSGFEWTSGRTCWRSWCQSPSEPVTDRPDFKQVYCRNDDLLTERSTRLVLQMSYSVMNGDLLFRPLLKLSRCKPWRDFFFILKVISKRKCMSMSWIWSINLIWFSDDRRMKNSCCTINFFIRQEGTSKITSWIKISLN